MAGYTPMPCTPPGKSCAVKIDEFGALVVPAAPKAKKNPPFSLALSSSHQVQSGRVVKPPRSIMKLSTMSSKKSGLRVRFADQQSATPETTEQPTTPPRSSHNPPPPSPHHHSRLRQCPSHRRRKPPTNAHPPAAVKCAVDVLANSRRKLPDSPCDQRPHPSTLFLPCIYFVSDQPLHSARSERKIGNVILATAGFTSRLFGFSTTSFRIFPFSFSTFRLQPSTLHTSSAQPYLPGML
jgi:hypothetical protein